MRSTVSLLLAFLLVPAPAAAQWDIAWLGDQSAERVDDQLEMAATLESTVMVLDYGLEDLRELHIESYSFVATAQARIAQAVGLEARVPFAMQHSRLRRPPPFDPPPAELPNDFWNDELGSPWLGAYWVPEHVDAEREIRIRGRIGLGVAIPRGEGAYDPAYARLAAAHWDDWLFRPAEGSVVLPGAIEARLWRYAYFGASGAGAVFWDEYARQRAILQLGLEAGVEPLVWLRVSVRGTGVGALGNRDVFGVEWGRDDVAFALQPRLAAAYGPVLGWVGVTLPLNGLFGPERPVYQPYAASVQLGLGGRW